MMNDEALGPEWDPDLNHVDPPDEGLILQLILASHQAAVEEGPEAGTMTTTEASQALDCGRRKATRILNQLVDMGFLDRDHVRRADSWGRPQRPPGFRITQKGLEEGPDWLVKFSQNGQKKTPGS